MNTNIPPAPQDLIKGLRASGMSQMDIARVTGIPQPTISRWEAGGAPESTIQDRKLIALYISVCKEAA